MKHIIPAALACTLAALLPVTAATVDFDSLPVGVEGYWNGSDESGGFASGGATFVNNYNTAWGSWSGFACSNHTDTTTPGFFNKYRAFTGGGAGGSSQYALGGGDSTGAVEPTIEFEALTDLAGLGASFTNTTYSALSMRDGDGFAKKFGGLDGTESDFFRLTIHGYAGGLSTGTVDFYLADFRFGNSGQDYIVDEWTFVDFSALGSVDELRFSFASSDVGAFVINTPLYFAMDDFLAVPEPSTLLASLAGFGLLLRRRR